MPKKIKTMTVAHYNGHDIKTNKSVNLGLKFNYDELPNYIKLIQFLNEDITIKVKLSGEKVKSLGIFKLQNLKIDHDGEGVAKFNSLVDYVEVDELNTLVGSDIFKVMFETTTEAADEDGDDDGEE